MEWSYSSPLWEWSFALQVEEVSPRLANAKNAPPPSRIWLNVSHMEAQHLLGNEVNDPADLREDTVLLNQLREKLYILWGDLEERKRSEDEGGDGNVTATKRARLDGEQQDEEQPQPSNFPLRYYLLPRPRELYVCTYLFSQWFDEKATLLENIDMQLRRLHNNVEVLVMNRKELAVNTSQFAKAAAMLSNCEEHTGLSRALSQLADVEEKVTYDYSSLYQVHSSFL
jgi:hypothetical protein